MISQNLLIHNLFDDNIVRVCNHLARIRPKTISLLSKNKLLPIECKGHGYKYNTACGVFDYIVKCIFCSFFKSGKISVRFFHILDRIFHTIQYLNNTLIMLLDEDFQIGSDVSYVDVALHHLQGQKHNFLICQFVNLELYI